MRSRLLFHPCSLVLALLSVLSLPGSAALAVELPGVRGHLYESPAFGFSLVWDPALWWAEHAESTPTEDVLQLTNASARVLFSAFVGYDGDYIACIDDLIDGLIAERGSDVLEQQQYGDSGIGWGDYGVAYAVYYETVPDSAAPGVWSWLLMCVPLDQNAGTVLQVVRLGLPNYVNEWIGEGIGGLSRPAPGWVPGLPVTEGLIAIEVDEVLWEEAAPPRGFDTVSLMFTFENLDTLPASLDLGRFAVRVGEQIVAMDDYQWHVGGPDGRSAEVILAGGAIAWATVTFTVPLNPESPRTSGSILYDTDGGTVWIDCFGVCGGGPGSSPRIRTGI